MTVPNTSTPIRGGFPRRLAGGLMLAVASAALASCASSPSEQQLLASDPPPAKPKETLVGGLPLFANWPKDQKPDAVIVFTGQTFGYMQPCGCSRPQIGGLERRAVLIQSLKAKGWPVVGVDLGDIAPEKSALSDQGVLKYKATMNALREMDYIAVGIGSTELKANLFPLLASYALQKEQRPFTLAGNAVVVAPGKPVPRAQAFPGPGKRPMVELIEVGKPGAIPVGVAGVVGKALREENQTKKWDSAVDFPDTKQAIADAADALAKHELKPRLNVLIYQGDSDCAAKIAKDFKQFQVILCQSPDGAPPPLQPLQVPGTKTLLVQVGQKGQHVGVLGAFKKPDGSFEFKYQLVPLGEEFITPGTDAEAIKANKVLLTLEDYAQEVKKAKLLPQYPRVPHPAQIQASDLKPPVQLKFVGSQACQACHAAEFNKWKSAPHSHAMATLENVAKRPSLRQFDGECVKCHSVGFEYKTGYVDDIKTPLLRDVGCENCHGPGSGHVATPKNKDLLAFLSPWKVAGAAKLDLAVVKKKAETPKFERGAIQVLPAQQMLSNRIEGVCMKCHDHEADPDFDFYKNWLKIEHSGLAPAGGWPAVAPKPAPENPAPRK